MELVTEAPALSRLDSLTGLANRELFNEHLIRALARARQNQHHIALLLLDLDDFTTINRTLGNKVGDAVLRGVADALRVGTRSTDMLARLGGDEFAVLIDSLLHISEADIVAHRILAALQAPILVGQARIHVAASMGISVFPMDAAKAGALLHFASSRMFLAKQRGGNHLQLYTAHV